MVRRKRRILLAAALVGLAALLAWLYVTNTAISVTHYAVTSEALPEAFDGFVVAQVSDLHNAEFGEGSAQLLDRLRAASPDLIAVTGDLIDARRTDVGAAMAFIRGAVEIAPVYYVAGNHEARSDAFESLEAQLIEAGVHVLRNEGESIERGGASLWIAGLDDPAFASGTDPADLIAPNGFTLLLSHRPELFEDYCDAGAHLVLTGHAHGGQVRLPWLGGLYAPNQGILPEYDAGRFESGDTVMIVSRGLGNSAFPIRVNNPPELVVVELRAGEPHDASE